jgi:RNA polymerase sigma-70 factor (ECF subfamily)
MPITRDKILEIASSLPPAPQVLSSLAVLLADPNSSVDDIALLLKRDAALAAHVIRMSNSVGYGGESRVGTVEEAVARVGLQEIFRLVSEVAMAQLVDRPLKNYGIEADELRSQMLETAFACEELASECNFDPRSAYTAGLMRPLGLLVVDRLADAYEIAPYHPAQDPDYLTWEGRVFGISSCDVAGMVLTRWGFPPEIIEAVRSQYLVRFEDQSNRMACLVNVAGGLVADAGHALLGETEHWGMTEAKLDVLGISEDVARAAGRRAAGAAEKFQSRLSTPRESHRSRRERETAGEAAGGEAADDSEPAPAGGGAPSPAAVFAAKESCNFQPAGGVLQANDEPPVQTSPTGVIAPTDFTTFMRNYQDMVFSTAVRLVGNEAQAEDISQEVFLKAYERFDSLQSSPAAGGWLKTVATNLSLNHLSRYRKRWRFFSEFRRDDAEGDDAGTPDIEFAAPDTFFSGVDAGERRQWVEEALAKLPEHQRVPLVLYHFEDLPYEEIAKRLRVSLAKVKTDILRARAALAQILQRSGTAHEKFVA